MPLRDLTAWILENPTFQAAYRRVMIESAQDELPVAVQRFTADVSAEPHDWSYLLLTASVLAAADDSQVSAAACHDAALRIAQFCLSRGAPTRQTALSLNAASRTADVPVMAGAEGGEAGVPWSDLSNGPTETQRTAAANVLDQLANRPAIALAARRAMLPDALETRLPLPARIEWVRRRLEHSVALADDTALPVNRFQRRFWSDLEAHDWLSVSAPTSAGKSYIVTRWVIDLLQQRPGALVIYVVPTRALITQVEADFRALVAASGLRGVEISSVPLARRVDASQSAILVLTPERVHMLLTAAPDLVATALIVDEAHKVGDGHRGVLLQQVIERVTRDAPESKVLFASPLTSNPELLVADAPPSRSRTSFTSREVTVNQNLIWVNQMPRDRRAWDVSLCLADRIEALGQLTLPATPDGSRKTLAYIAHAMSGNGIGNVVYVNGANEAEKVALLLYELEGEGRVLDPRLKPLIDLTRKTVHPEFALARVLTRGVAFHYGNIPHLIRTEVERLFSEGAIRFLVCTSTLVEGVNMSCRAIYVRGPTKGAGTPMSAEDFWNLAGRAGRWGKEFQGSVVCIDTDQPRLWGPDGPPRRRALNAMRRTADSVVARPDDLLAFISAGTPRNTAVKRPDLEFTFSYLMTQHLRGESIRELPWTRRLDPDAVDRVAEAIGQAAEGLQTPLSVIERNPGLSPLAMDALLRRFGNARRDVAELLPADPSSNDALESYRGVIGRTAAELNAALGPTGRRTNALALLISRWMNGRPIARLIADREHWERQQDRPKSLPTIIRTVLADVEKIARFEAPRSLACYTDLLRVFYERVERPDLMARVPADFHLMLEFGVSIPTQMSLIALGMSRTSAVLLGELLTNDTMSEADVVRWLSGGGWREADLPELVVREVDQVLARHLV